MANGTCLKFVRVDDLAIIPRRFFDKVKPKINVDRLLQWSNVISANKFNIIGCFFDSSENIRGFMWMTVNPICESVDVHMASVDKEYYGMGILKEIIGIANKVKNKVGAKTITCITTRPRAFIKYGAKQIAVKMEK